MLNQTKREVRDAEVVKLILLINVTKSFQIPDIISVERRLYLTLK